MPLIQADPAPDVDRRDVKLCAMSIRVQCLNYDAIDPAAQDLASEEVSVIALASSDAMTF